jgi:hypothetical protein
MEGGRPLPARDGGRGRAGRLLNGFENRSEQGAANETGRRNRVMND